MNYYTPDSKAFDVCYKVLVLGESRVGKTSIIKRLDNRGFSENTISTVGIDFVNVYYCIENTIIKLQIWDTAGQERFHTLTRGYFNKTKGIVLVYDITSRESFERLEYWMECIDNMNLISEIIFLIGNKNDLERERQVSYEQAKRFADRNSIKFFETSAKLSTNLFEIFKTLAFDVFNWNDMMKINNPIKKHEVFAFNYNMPQDIVLRNNNSKSLFIKTKKPAIKFNPFKKKIKNNDNNNYTINTLSNCNQKRENKSLSLSLSSLANIKKNFTLNNFNFNFNNNNEKQRSKKSLDRSKSKEKLSSRLNLRFNETNKIKLDHGCCKIS